MKITTLGKLLTIFLTVASMLFVGFAMATTFGGPNWQEVVDLKYFDGYRIAKSAGADAQWSAVRGSDEANVASSKVLPEVLSKVMDEVLQKNQQEMQAISEREPKLQAKIAELEAAKEADKVALEKYVAELRDRLKAIREQEEQTATQVIAATNEAQKLETQTAARRDDVLRLQEQVDELRADQFRLQNIEVELVDLLNQMRGSLERAEHRAQLLSGTDPNYNPPPVQQ